MRFLIDGHNLLHAALKRYPKWVHMSFGSQKRGLLEFITTVLAEDCSGITVVFDGVAGALRAQAQSVEIIYSGKDSDADAAIERIIASDSAPRHLTVVSSDRRVRAAARRRRAVSVGSEDFLALLQKRFRKRSKGLREPPYKFEGTPEEDRKFWQEVFDVESLEALAAEAERPTGGKAPPRTPPKSDDEHLSSDELNYWLKQFGLDEADE